MSKNLSGGRKFKALNDIAARYLTSGLDSKGAHLDGIVQSSVVVINNGRRLFYDHWQAGKRESTSTRILFSRYFTPDNSIASYRGVFVVSQFHKGQFNPRKKAMTELRISSLFGWPSTANSAGPNRMAQWGIPNNAAK